MKLIKLRNNFYQLEMKNCYAYFSYETFIGIMEKKTLKTYVVSSNSITTARHINYIDPEPCTTLTTEELNQKLKEIE